MARVWTDDQQKAIDTTDKAVIVSAAAGSGKTAVLIERTIRLLCDKSKGISADRLLAVTFTNDAAAQMRDKLNSALIEKIEENPDDEWLQMQQMRLQTARISTINSFCFDLVKSNIHNFDITAGVRILDDTEKEIIQANAIDDVFEKFYAEQPQKMQVLCKAFCLDSDYKLVEIVAQLYKFSRSLPFKDNWFESVLSFYDENSEMRLNWEKRILDKIAITLKSVKSSIEFAEKSLDSLGEYPKAVETINSDLNFVEELIGITSLFNWDDISAKISQLKFGTLTIKQSADVSNIDKALIESVKLARKSYKDTLKDLSKTITCNQSQIASDMKYSREILSYLIEIVNELWREIWQCKAEKNAVDFSDLEILSISLLAEIGENGVEKTQLAKNMISSKQYEIILIDEFQDVNNLQDIIFKMLSNNTDNTLIGKNMFVVGDVKQSIYRFRQANPHIFIQTRKDANNPENSETITEINLRKNFRSRKCVVDFVNFVFENIMSEQIGEVNYTAEEKLELGASYDERLLSTEIIVIDENTEIDDSAENSASEDSDSAESDDDESVSLGEAAAVAVKIRKMLDAGYKVWEDGINRPCRPGDFCILMRNKTQNKKFVEAFHAQGLSVTSEEETGFLRSREISVLINMLMIIDRPTNEIAMASVLMSPLFLFSADEVSCLRLLFPKKKLISAMKLAFKEKDAQNITEELSKKCLAAVEKIDELRFLAAGISLEELIDRIYDSTEFFAIISALNDGAKKRANLRLLREYAASYEMNSHGGLSGFIRYINSVFKNKKDFAQAGTFENENDCVVIKTIHKSKGLEFPFVFLCRTSSMFNKRELREPILMNLNSGIGFKLKDPDNQIKFSTIAYDALLLQNGDELLSEEMRLLYVALTRAKEQLFITYVRSAAEQKKVVSFAKEISASRKITSSIVRSAKSLQDWIAMALLTSGGDFLSGYPLEDLDLPTFKTDAIINICSAEGPCCLPSVDKEESEDSNVEISEKTYNEVKRYIDFQYDSTLADIPAKLSVSEIVKGDSEYKYRFTLPALDKQRGGLSAAEKGTAIHLFMEKSDFEKAEISVQIEIERLISNETLTQKQGGAIKIDSVKGFFDSDIYKRLKKSQNVMREKQFIVRIADLKIDDERLAIYKNTDGMLQGVADCIFEETDGYVLIDYKTDNVKQLDELTGRYYIQLELYKAAFELILEKPIKSSYIYSFKLGEGIEIEF